MKQWVLVSAAVAVAAAFGVSRLGAAPGQAGGRPPEACQADIKKLCAEVKPGAGRVLRCLDRHKDEASKPCKSALADAVADNGASHEAAADKKSKADTYSILEFVIVTGSDDLRGDSTAWAVVKRLKGKAKTCQLKTIDQDSWGNGSTHTVTCELGSPLTLANLQKTKIVIAYNGTGQALETQDNWNLNGVTINAYNQDHKPICIFSTSGNPLHRFQDVHGGAIVANDSIVVTDFPSRCR